jgi:predicted AlkP superfamily pyrophosphatase or phosphodiesterase
MKPFALSFVLFSLCFAHSPLSAQSGKTDPASDVPRLVVGIVVDQMRNDYIYRYWSRYGTGGFKRLVNEGYYFRNAHYNYIPTYTGPGHSSIYTGAPPRAHGIIANDWYVKETSALTYCTQDSTVKPVGSESRNGRMSPRNQLSSTIGDELKMSSAQRAKVFAVSMKDRSSIFPAGHAANGAFWFDDATGNFISSTWYMQDLPAWLKQFNAKQPAKTFLEKGWQTLYPLSTYSASLPDQNRYEAAPGNVDPVFPYEYSKQIMNGKWGILKSTPAGNTLTKDLALACLIHEAMGKGPGTDLLCVSFSCTDYVGHYFGPRAIETEDVYLRLDKDLEDLLNTLDKTLGKGNYSVFLTADHGGADVPNHLLDHKIPAGYIREPFLEQETRAFFKKHYNDSSLLLNVSNEQFFLNEEKIRSRGLDLPSLEEHLCAFLRTLPGIAEAYGSFTLRNTSYEGSDIRALLQNGYHHRRSGHVAIVYQPGWMDNGPTGTTHGSAYNYDTHIPLIFYGKGIKKGESFRRVAVTQIAPTVCELIRINQPNAATGEPLNGFFKD